MLEHGRMLEHRHPLDQLAAPQLRSGPELRLVPVTRRGLLLIQARSAGSSIESILHRTLGLQLPAPLKTERGEHAAILWLGPREWLLELPRAATLSAYTHLQECFARSRASSPGESSAPLGGVIDVSDAFAGIDVSGTRAVDVLKSGCSLDLEPQSFAVGDTARTALAEVPAILWRLTETPGPGLYRCWVERGFATHLAHWLAEAPAGW
ncbi:MAG TPA: sarcosine oxidase subunit gamma family protein [Steroidobacteraceae bacterium]|nr:sarcosine oxidase subunit gamma family protein [Steroidobacteraceae bacterium]